MKIKPSCYYYDEKTKKRVDGYCAHLLEEHRNGVCWHIVDPKLENSSTDKKYCKCRMSPENIHPSTITGFFPDNEEDWMKPKLCQGCSILSLIRVDETRCIRCREDYLR